MLQFSKSPRQILSLCGIAGGLLFYAFHISHAAIVVQGSDNREATDLNLWCNHHIPTQFQPAQDVVVQQLNDREMNTYLANGNSDSNDSRSSNSDSDDDIDGIFENNPPRITLRLSSDTHMDMFTFAHEYGHFVWFDLLTKADRQKYEAIYNKQKSAKHLVTKYASTDLEEGFAEAFSFYINDKSMLQHRDPASYSFLKTWSPKQSRTSHRFKENRPKLARSNNRLNSAI